MPNALFGFSFESYKKQIESDAWEQTTEIDENGEKFVAFAKFDEATSLLAMRFIAIIDFPVEQAASVWFANHEQKKDWMELCKDFRIVKYFSANKFILQFIGETPFPLIAPRTVVTEAEVKIDREKKAIRGTAISIDYPEAEIPEGMVVGIMHDSHTYMQAVGDDRTFLDLSVLLDPAGSIPKPLVNLVARGWPEKTYHRFVNHLKKGVAKEVDFFKSE